MSSIMKGLIDEGENVSVIYIDGKPSAKYANKYEAEKDADHIRKKFPNKRIEIKQEVREAEGDTLLDPEYALPQARGITKGIKYDDTVGEIITQIQMLAERTEGIDHKTLEYSIDGVLSAKNALESAVYDLEEAFEDAAREAQYKRDDVDEGNYHDNRTGFKRGPRDDERHDLDVQQPSKQVWGLKINGKVWSKDGVDVTFASKEQALKARQSLLAKRPELEVGLVTKVSEQGITEGSERVDSLVTDALKIMRGPELADAVQALKTVLGDREFSSRRGFYNFFIRQMMDMYKQRGVAEGLRDPKDNPCWKGYHPVGTKKKNGRTVPNCVPVEEAGSPAQQAAIAINMKKHHKKPKSLGESDSSDAVYHAVLNRIMRQHLDIVREYGPKAVMYAIEDVANGIGDLEEIGSSDVSIWTKEVINDLKSGNYEHLKETPTDNPTGASGEGGWRTYRPKSAGTVEEDTAYAGGMGQGHSGESYRKFKPKSAGTFESSIMKGLKRESK